jgi:hypothetical protein
MVTYTDNNLLGLVANLKVLQIPVTRCTGGGGDMVVQGQVCCQGVWFVMLRLSCHFRGGMQCFRPSHIRKKDRRHPSFILTVCQ